MRSLGRVTRLNTNFFNRDPRQVARALLGKLLVRNSPTAILAGRIVETEAYLGNDDAAAHTAAGKTPRNAVLFGPPGLAYVYFIYGAHFCLNVSCLPAGVPGGVLFRALEPLAGIDQMAAARGIAIECAEKSGLAKLSSLKKISSGPGRLAEAFSITRPRDNGKSLVSPRSDLHIVDDGYRVRQVTVTPRIGITKSAARPLRYFIAGNPFVSGRRL
ncbi:MAG: DNA-3-methyladenine glycosylase [Terriglobales bacterium]|jgi:DNA-3-methyladenine glycosylase